MRNPGFALRALVGVGCAVVVWGYPSVAGAQLYRGERPYRGVFGGGLSETEQSLTVTATLGTGIDDVITQDVPPVLEPETQPLDETEPPSEASPIAIEEATGSAQYTQFAGALNYSLRRNRVRIEALAATVGRHYPESPDGIITASSGNFAAAWDLARYTTLESRHSISYQPVLTLAGLPEMTTAFGVFQPPNLDAGVRRDEFLGYIGGIGFSHRLSRRGTLSGTYDYNRQQVTADDPFESHAAAARYSHSLTRHLTGRVGYGQSRTQFPGTEGVARGHNLDAGVDFARAIGLSRRTTMSFGTGATAVDYEGELTYLVIGNVRLTKQFGRTWTGSIGYDRNVQYIRTFNAPAFADAGNITVNGEFSRRLQYYLQLGASLSNLGDTSANGFETFTGVSGLTVGLNRHLALGAGYTWFRYVFDSNAFVPAGLPRAMTRHGVMVSLNAWLPLFERLRRTDAPR